MIFLDKTTITVREAAQMSGIGITRIYNYANNDEEFPSFKVGRKILIHKDAFNEWLANIAKQRSAI